MSESQSPIDLTNPTPADIGKIAFDYHQTPISIEDTGYTIQFHCKPGSSIEINGVCYELQQFHFHVSSEHTVEGQYSAMEMHLVHVDKRDNFAVLGVMIESGEEDHKELAAIWGHLPAVKEIDRTVEPEKINVVNLLPDNLNAYYRYRGSLTTPPYSENVLWTIFAEPIIFSETQIAAFEDIYKDNFRAIQPLNGRELLHNDDI